MFNKKQKGFTLIELLVVIAIIGLLAGIVLVSLGGARDSARNARVQGALQQTRSIAELVYNSTSPLSYATLCNASNVLNDIQASYATQLINLGTDIKSQNGGTEPVCYAAGDNFCVSALKAGAAGGVFCISSTGQSGDDVCAAATTACAP